MGEINDAAIIEALRRQMSIAAARQVVAASNLANASTPGYRTQQIDFDAALDRELGGTVPLATTEPGHLPGAEAAASAAPTRDVDGLSARRDGNTVQLDRELLDMTVAASDFARAQTVLAAKFRLLRYAISEGK